MVQVLLQNGVDNVFLPALTAEEIAGVDEHGIPAPYVPPREYFGDAEERAAKVEHKLSAKEMEMYNALYKVVKAGRYLELINLLDKGAPTENKDEFGNTVRPFPWRSSFALMFLLTRHFVHRLL